MSEMNQPEQPEHKPAPAYDPASPEGKIREALRAVRDPELGLDVVQLGLIRAIKLNQDEPEIEMMLTTPFCPYAGWMVQQVKDAASQHAGKPFKITILPDLWDPNFMEDPSFLLGW